jgi:hypothetical protein
VTKKVGADDEHHAYNAQNLKTGVALFFWLNHWIAEYFLIFVFHNYSVA